MVNYEKRAVLTEGVSNDAIYQLVFKTLHPIVKSGTLVDVGCGQANLLPYISELCDQYVGVDLIKYEGFPLDREFRTVNFDTGRVDLPDDFAEAICAVETIEHLENPRAFVRELVRLAKPNGVVAVTTPNQLSIFSKLTLVFDDQFYEFRDTPSCYPAHITALLAIDLVRIFTECGLKDIQVGYGNPSRIPLTSKRWASNIFHGKNFSDNIICVGWKK